MASSAGRARAVGASPGTEVGAAAGAGAGLGFSTGLGAVKMKKFVSSVCVCVCVERQCVSLRLLRNPMRCVHAYARLAGLSGASTYPQPWAQRGPGPGRRAWGLV